MCFCFLSDLQSSVIIQRNEKTRGKKRRCRIVLFEIGKVKCCPFDFCGFLIFKGGPVSIIVEEKGAI